AALNDRSAQMNRELEALAAVPEEIAARRSRLLDAIERADATRREAADARAQAETQLAEADRVAKAADSAFAQSREERAGCEARAKSATARLSELAARVREELSATPDELAERAELKPDSELPPVDVAEKKIEKLKAEREQLGGVNL